LPGSRGARRRRQTQQDYASENNAKHYGQPPD
jgi:hypothetical protein